MHSLDFIKWRFNHYQQLVDSYEQTKFNQTFDTFTKLWYLRYLRRKTG